MVEEVKRIPYTRRIRTRLTAAVLLAIILPLIIFYAISNEIAEDKLLKQIDNRLAFVSVDAAAAFNDLVEGVASNLRVDLHAYDFEQWGDRKSIMAASFLLRRLASVARLSYVGLDGTELIRLSQTEVYFDKDLRDLSNHPALDVVRTGERYVGPPILTREGVMFDVATPYVNTDGELIGMFLAGVTLRQLYEEYLARSIAVRIIYVTDRHGVVIAHPDFRLVVDEADASNIEVVAKALLEQPGVSTPMMRYMNLRGREVFGVGTTNKFGWAFIAELPVEDAMASVIQARRGFGIVFIGASLAGLLVSLYIGGKAASAIIRIQRTARRLGGGDFSERVRVGANDEIGALAAAINTMADKLAESYKHLEGDVDLLNRKVAQRTESLQKAYDDLKRSETELRSTQAALVQTEKLASLGMLVAGVVHEVNNPLAFIMSNISVLKRNVQQLAGVADKCRQASAETDLRRRSSMLEDARRMAEELDLEEMLESVERLLSRTDEGLLRIKKIVSDLRDFSHMGETEKAPADLNANIDSVIGMVAYELKKKQIKLEKDFGELPPVMCAAMKINQVVLNILINAIQAVGEGGHIWVKTWREENMAGFSIRDDGPGIPSELLGKIFDPFFTTRPPGEGTGLGLSISYGIITEHNGTIFAASEPGKGAEFIVRIPIRPEKQGDRRQEPGARS